MIYLFDIDPVVVLMGTDPLDPNDALLEIYRHDQPVIIALDIEYDPVSCHDAGRRVEALHISRTGPICFAHLIEPGVESCLRCCLVLMARSGLNEFTKRPAGNDTHSGMLPCTHFGHKM